MRARVLKVALLVILTPVIYWGATAAMIENSARYLSSSHGCIVWVPFDHTGFLVSMGQRSIPALRRQIASPGVGMSSKIHLTWVLARLGDYSQFQVFINGLKSKRRRHQYIAAVRMQDFPQECFRHLPAILAAGHQKQHSQYWSMLTSLAYKANLSENKKKVLAKIMNMDKVQEKGLSRQETQSIMQLFGSSANQQPHNKTLHPDRLQLRSSFLLSTLSAAGELVVRRLARSAM